MLSFSSLRMKLLHITLSEVEVVSLQGILVSVFFDR